MSQNTVNFSDNPNGPELMDDYLAKEQENRLTTNSGIQRPSYVKAGTPWINNSTNPWKLYIYDGTSDVLIGDVDATNHEFISSNFEDVVNLTTNQTVAGVKTFSASPVVPTPSSSDNSSKVANTSFVASVATGLQTQINSKASDSAVVKTSGNQTVDGIKNFSNSIRVGGTTYGSYARDHVEFFPLTTSSNGGYIDFHYAGSSADYTSRIKEIASGEIDFECSTVTAPTPVTSDNSSKIATTAFVKDNLKNFSVNISERIDLALNLDTSYTFPSSGLFVLTAYVKGQSDPAIEVRMKDTAGADTTSRIICQIAHHGGGAEYNKIPFSIYVQKGQSIYLQRSGSGTVSVSHTYLFPVML